MLGPPMGQFSKLWSRAGPRRVLSFAFGSIGRVVGTAIVIGLVIIAFGMTPGELIAYLWANPPNWVNNGWTRLLVLIFGLALLYSAVAYNIWIREERNARLRLQFDPTTPGCVEINGVAPKRCLTVRILPVTSSRVENCTGYLLKISESADGKNWAATNWIDPVQLTWIHHVNDATPKRIERDIPRMLDLFYILEQSKALTPSLVKMISRPLPNFASGKWFRFDVRVSGDDDVSAAISLKMKWGAEEWDRPEVKKIG
jgi:hypothetical protein